MTYTGDNLKELMSAAQSEEDWKARCDAVKAHHGDYPENWYEDVILLDPTTGASVLGATMARWSRTKRREEGDV